MIHGIFTGHANLPFEMVNTCETIIGKQENYTIITNRDLSNDDIYKLLEKSLKENAKNNKEFFIFIDFYGSSVSLPVIKLIQNSSYIIFILFGYNLPMIIDFFIHRNKLTGEKLYMKLIEVGKRGIR